MLGNIGNGQANVLKKVFRSFDSYMTNLFADAATEQNPKVPFKKPARDRYNVQNVRNGNRPPAIIVDEADGCGHIRVRDSEHIGRAANDNSQRRHQHRFLRSCAAAEHRVQHGGGLVTDFLGRDGNTGERRTGQLAQKIVIVYTEYAHILRNT